MKSGPNALAMVEKRVLFRSISGPLSTLQPSQNQESSSSSSKDIIVTDLIGSAEERQSAPKSKSFTYGCSEREEIKQRLSVDEQDFEHPLLEVVDGTGTSPELLEAVANAMASNVERFELLEQMMATVQVGGLQSNPFDPPGPHHPRVTHPTIFHGMRPPPITIPAYLERIAKYSRCSPVCFVMATSYIDRLVERYADFTPTSLSIHRLILTSVMLAAKLTDDHYFNNAFYSRVGGVSIQELNRMEISMLQLLDYKLVLTVDATRHYLKLLLGGTMVLGSGEGTATSMSAARKRRSGNGSMCDRRQSRRSSASSGGGGLSSGPHSSGYQDPDDQDDDEQGGREAGGENGEEVASGAATKAQNGMASTMQQATAEVLRQGSGRRRFPSSPGPASAHRQTGSGSAPMDAEMQGEADVQERTRHQEMQQEGPMVHPSFLPDTSPVHRSFHSFSQLQHVMAQQGTGSFQRHSSGQVAGQHQRPTSHPHRTSSHHTHHANQSAAAPVIPRAVGQMQAGVTFAGVIQDDLLDPQFRSRHSYSHARSHHQQHPSSPQQQHSNSEKLPQRHARCGEGSSPSCAPADGGMFDREEEEAGNSRRQRQNCGSPAPAELHRNPARINSDSQQPHPERASGSAR